MEEQKNSRLGIASYVICVIDGVVLLLTLAMIALHLVVGDSGRPFPPEGSLDSFLFFGGTLGLFFIGYTIPIAFLLGIAGLLRRKKKKRYAIIGVIGSAIPMLLYGGAMIVIIFCYDYISTGQPSETKEATPQEIHQPAPLPKEKTRPQTTTRQSTNPNTQQIFSLCQITRLLDE